MSVNDEIPGTPVALLGRAGPARERLREALALAGAQIVLEDDPAAVDAQTLSDAGPTAVLVALEPAIEDALEALEPALALPGVTVIFDEADLAVRREGWEAQRWARHLAAKLHGHGNVLPPGAESEAPPQPEPGRPLAPPAQAPELPLDLHLEAAAAALDAVPGDALFEAPRAPAPPPAEAGSGRPDNGVAPALGDSSTWGLVDDVAVVTRTRTEPDLSRLSTGGLSLVDLESGVPETDAVGAVLVVAGIGGPDAIRRLLAALPATFPRAVLVRMALDGGQYGNLVRQMGRVSALPVELAALGAAVVPGTVYVLSDDLGLRVRDATLGFVAGGAAADLVTALPAADSAVLMLSGASDALVDDVLALAAQGAWVAGQASDGCYDPAAAARLARQGAASGDPAQLAQALAQRWPA